MPPLPTTLNFKTWKRSKLFASAELKMGQPRLSGTLTLTLSDDAGGVPRKGDAPFTLMSAADVGGLKAGAILRTAPPAFARDAETTKLVHVDFAEPDLPWRYTPRTNTPNIRPWLALLVGTAEELQIEANIVKTVSADVLKAHKLADSYAWAHVQDNAHSRLLSPCKLKPQHEYVAALVPAFTSTGEDAWDDNATKGVLRVFHSWRFWTSDEGDFETLAARLRAPKSGAIGRARLHYPREVVINAIAEKPIFEVRGAISSLQPDLGRIQPETMNDGQLSDALRSLKPWADNATPDLLLTEERRALLTLFCQIVQDKVQPDELDDTQLLEVLSSLKPLLDDVNFNALSLAEKRTLLLKFCQTVFDRVQPATLNNTQLLDMLRLLKLVLESVNIVTLTLMEKRALLLQFCQPVRDRIKETHKDLDVLNDAVADAGKPTREIISLPHYGRPWLPNPDDATEGWPEALNDDPRFRGLSGLGVWMGVEGQEALMDAAVEQAGALRDAGSRISHLALGVLAAGGLWQRRLSEDKNARLRIFGPMMARMLAGDGGTVLGRVTSGTSPLTPAWFSSAGQRLLRDGATHSRYTLAANGAPGGLHRSAILDLANQPTPLPERSPKGLPSIDAIAEEMGLPPFEKLLEIDEEALEKIRAELAAFMEDAAHAYAIAQTDAERRALADEVAHKYTLVLQELLANFHLPCEGQQLTDRMARQLNPRFAWPEIIEDALIEESERDRLEDALIREVRRCMTQRACRELARHLDVQDRDAFCDDVLDNLPQPPRQTQQPIDLGRLHDVLDAALDPRKIDAPARRRVAATIHGLDLSRLIPPQFPIGLNFPTWELLRQYDKEWLLPGAGALEKDSVTALQTNPAFVDAYMVGINTQFMNEMRWRDLAVARDCTPLRMFWGQMNYDVTEQKRQADIQPLAEWAKALAKDVGDLSHQTIQPADPGNATGSRLVIVFRSDLFRRYPNTLVYLVKRDATMTSAQEDDLLKAPPLLEHTEANRPNRIHLGPTFIGILTPEITFFCFDISPETLDQYWLVLDEPPTELRFRNDRAANKTNAATFADTTLDRPTRVAISGKHLEEQGLAANP